jgi:hypothetical protein
MDMNWEMSKMMKRKWFKASLMTCGIFFLPLIGYLFYIRVWDSSTAFLLKEKELQQKDFLQNQQSIVYFSTTDPQNGFNDGLSYAVFIDDQGKAKSWKMHGLEAGSMATNSKQVFIEESDKVRLVGQNYQVFSMKDKQHTGERTGYLKKDHLFYSIYNSGFDTRGGYGSDVRWGNEHGFQTSTIPHYIASSGDDGEHIYVLTTNMTETRYDLQEVNLTPQKMETKSLTGWEKTESTGNLSSIFVGKHALYVVLYGIESDSHVQLLEIDKQTHQREMYTLIRYTEEQTKDYDFMPLKPRKLHLFHQELYYIDGFGDVYTFNIISKKVQKRFSLLDFTPSGGGNDEHLYFRDQYVYFFHFQPKTKKYLIEKYNLLNGKREAVQEITGIKEIMAEVARRGKFAPIYDFKMLHDF